MNIRSTEVKEVKTRRNVNMQFDLFAVLRWLLISVYRKETFIAMSCHTWFLPRKVRIHSQYCRERDNGTDGRSCLHFIIGYTTHTPTLLVGDREALFFPFLLSKERTGLVAHCQLCQPPLIRRPASVPSDDLCVNAGELLLIY